MGYSVDNLAYNLAYKYGTSIIYGYCRLRRE